MDEEVLDDAVEEGAVVVALEAELHEVARRLGGLLGPQLDIEGAGRRLHHHLALRRGLKHVHRRHPARLVPVASASRRRSRRLGALLRAWLLPAGRAVRSTGSWLGLGRIGSGGERTAAGWMGKRPVYMSWKRINALRFPFVSTDLCRFVSLVTMEESREFFDLLKILNVG